MRSIQLLAITISCLGVITYTSATSAEPQVRPQVVESLPHYGDLTDWLADIRRKGFQLLKAGKQNGYYFAIYKTSSGTIVFCNMAIEKRFAGSSFDVTAADGTSVLDHDFNPVAIVRRFEVVSDLSKALTTIVDGKEYGLTNNKHSRLIVRFAEKVGDAYKDIVIESVEWEVNE